MAKDSEKNERKGFILKSGRGNSRFVPLRRFAVLKKLQNASSNSCI